MATDVKLTFHTDKVVKSIEDAAAKKMAEAVIAVHKATVETLSTAGTDRRYLVPGTKTWYTASSPGQPPARATGTLAKSVKYSVEGEGRTVVGKVGTELAYGRMLEFGTRGGAIIRPKGKVLAFGVDGKMAFATQVIQGPILPRPWLKPSFEKSLDKVKSILSRKWL